MTNNKWKYGIGAAVAAAAITAGLLAMRNKNTRNKVKDATVQTVRKVKRVARKTAAAIPRTRGRK